jgi:uncharacterized protein CbrC (UPF0167 family)
MKINVNNKNGKYECDVLCDKCMKNIYGGSIITDTQLNTDEQDYCINCIKDGNASDLYDINMIK